MAVPIILVSDHNTQPPTTIHYICGANILGLPTVFLNIKSLYTHPGRGYTDANNTITRLCTPAFLDAYWSSAANLLDYFADFHAIDNPAMHNIWFHLLDVWHEVGGALPHVWDTPDKFPSCTHSREFEAWLDDTIRLLSTTLFTPLGHTAPSDPVVFDPTGAADRFADAHNTGPWRSGWKPWQQFLCEASPGVATPWAGGVMLSGDGAGGERVRHVPMPAIGIVKKHTERARRLANNLAAQGDGVDTDLLSTFEAHCLRFPATARSHSYTSFEGRVVTYQLGNGAPPVSRYGGHGDPDMLAENPSLTLLDECVGICKGVEAYEAVSEIDEGEDEDEWDEQTEEEEVPFDMWTVRESGGMGEDNKVQLLGAGHEAMFDDWCVDDD